MCFDYRFQRILKLIQSISAKFDKKTAGLVKIATPENSIIINS